MREVRYFTSKVAFFSLSALVVRKVTGGVNNRVAMRKVMRKVPGDAPRAARGRRKSGEEIRGRVNKGERAVRVEPVHNNQRQYNIVCRVRHCELYGENSKC